LSASGVVMLGGVGCCRLQATIPKTTSPLSIPASRASAHARATAVLGDTAENLHELPIAVGMVLEARGQPRAVPANPSL
jgi:hypothetical protein